MKDKFIPISSSNFNFSKFKEQFNELDEGDFFLNSKFIDNFQESIKKTLKTDKEVVALSSGTSAIHIALKLAGVSEGDSVLCQTATYIATVNPVLYIGANPIFIDSEQDTWNICPITLEEAIFDLKSKGIKPKAMIVVHAYGMPAKMKELLIIAKKHQIILIEDAAEALGSSYQGKMCGTFGDFGILSFNNNKIVSANGGGALICNDEDKEQALFLTSHARDNEIYYQHSVIGYNYRLSNFLAGIGALQLKSLEENVLSRRENNLEYQKLFEKIDRINVFKEPSFEYYSNHWLTCILFKNDIKDNRSLLHQELLKSNIESRYLWKPMHLQPIFSKELYYGRRVAENLFLNGLCLPSSSNISKLEKERIHSCINKFIK